MCTYHHHHHLQGHAEVFLMLFYSWGFCTNLSEFTKQAWLAVYANCCLPRDSTGRKLEHRKVTLMQCTSFWTKITMDALFRKAEPIPCCAFKSCQSFLYYFKAGFDIIKLRSHKDILCNWTFLCLYLPFKTLSNTVGSDFFLMLHT